MLNILKLYSTFCKYLVHSKVIVWLLHEVFQRHYHKYSYLQRTPRLLGRPNQLVHHLRHQRVPASSTTSAAGAISCKFLPGNTENAILPSATMHAW